MAPSVVLHPGRISQFGASEGVTFCLVTNPALADRIRVEHDGAYAEYRTYLLHPGQRFEDLLLAEIPENTHIVVISPDAFFISPSPEGLGPRRKLLGMACNSTPTSLETIAHFLRVLEATSASEQDAFSDRFFGLLEEAEHLEYVNAEYGTRAVLDHLAEGLVWNQQAGALGWGDQQIVPPGEISVLPIEIFTFDSTLHLPLDGSITIGGHAILHSGTASFLRADQARIHAALAPMSEHAIIAQVEGGIMTSIRPADPGGAAVAHMLETMFELDSRYRYVWEIGHALNTSLDLLAGNHAMNETYGGTAGCLHWGIGLTPFTQYHLDVVAPGTTVYTSTGKVLLGTQARVAQPA
jgi:hypothetical protein